MNIDHGAVPAAMSEIKEELQFNATQMGRLGSLVFMGIIIGSLCAVFFMDKIPMKIVLSISFVGNGVGMILFIVFQHFALVGLARFISGFC